MELKDFLDHLNSGNAVTGGGTVHLFMHRVSQEALKITSEINGSYHEPEELRRLFSRLIGKEVDESFALFPPFYTDCGKNITIGKNVFINMGCKFQDQDGIFIGDGTLIGHNVVLATLSHRRKRMDWCKCYDSIRRYDWGRCDYCSRSRCDKGCSAKHHSSWSPCKSHARN